MREIKFRYYFSDNKHWRVEEFTLLEIENGYPYEVLSDNPLYRQYKLIERVQFTGLKDKNGKEIYEGDLLQIPVDDTIIEGIHQVFYYKDGFVTSSILFYNLETANKNSLTWRINRGAFVIGNIHETPELLTQNKEEK